MAMELILIEDVAGLGKIGDQVRVADGYARNFLLPRKLAAKTSPGVLRSLEAKKLRMQQEHEERLNVAKALAEKLAKLTLTIRVQAGEDDKLYGSVHTVQVLEALEKEGIVLEKSAVVMPEHIKALGYYTVDIHLHTEVQTTVKVSVERA